MIEALKEVLTIIEKLPHMALWILAGLLFYKIVIIGSWFGIAKLLIERLHSFAMAFRLKPKQLSIADMVIDGIHEDEIRDLLRSTPLQRDLLFVHRNHIEWIKTAIQEKKLRHNEELKKEQTK